jgi:hypothetical protein
LLLPHGRSGTRKLRDWLDHQDEPRHDAEAFVLLKVGRHLRLNDDVKLIVGRERRRRTGLANYRRGRFRVLRSGLHGPHGSGEARRDLHWEEIEEIARITARYGQGREEAKVVVRFRSPSGADEPFALVDSRTSEDVEVVPLGMDTIETLRV